MYQISIDQVSFQLNRQLDFSWLHRLGHVFRVFDKTGSGCVAFGVEDGQNKYFVKVAGADTVEAELPPRESVEALRHAAGLYQALAHPNLIELLDHYPLNGLYVAVFRWAQGENLFDYWNFERYRELQLPSPKERFRALPTGKRLRTAEVLFSFLETAARRGYVAVDLYDGSILYDFDSDVTTLCDIDFFRKSPAVNDMGENFWGSKRLKSPEEYRLGAQLTERTNVFTLGALLFDFFGTFTSEEVKVRYRLNAFRPCALNRWELSGACYHAAVKAVESDPAARYPTIQSFHEAWSRALTV